jgi:hypothetical protein
MQRLLRVPLLILSLLLNGCGQVFVHGSFTPDMTSVSGTVSMVQLTLIADSHGSTVTVTGVTLVSSGNANTINFCGDQRSQFPLNQAVRTNFQPGTPCATLVVVIVL